MDIDNTLTPPRRPLEAEMAEVLKSLTAPFFVAAGSDLTLVRAQFLEPLQAMGYRGFLDAFLCNGATRYRCGFGASLEVDLVRDFDFRQHLGEERFALLMTVIERLLEADDLRLPPPMQVVGPRITFRHSMVNVAPIGRLPGPLAAEAFRYRTHFVSFDGATGYRRRFLERLRAELGTPPFAGLDLEVSLGGETSFDIVVRDNDKTFPVRWLLAEGFKEVTFFGDALFEGGNDEAILRFITSWAGERPCPVEAIQVSGWPNTVERLRELGLVAGQVR